MDVVESSKGTGSSEVEPQMSHNVTEKNSAECVKRNASEQSSVQRRVSPRLTNIPKSKKSYYGNPSKKSIDLPKETDSGSHPINTTGSDHEMVKETLRIFHSHYLRCIQEEKKRCGKMKDKSMDKPDDLRPRRGDAYVQEAKRSSMRPDLKAMNKGLVLGNNFFHELKWLL